MTNEFANETRDPKIMMWKETSKREINHSTAEVNRRYDMVKLSSILFREMVVNIRNS